jgi:hypothetical protein
MDVGIAGWGAFALMLITSVCCAGGTTAPATHLANTGFSTGAIDARLIHHHDKDHPADFEPHYTTRAGWEQRAEFLRRQILVSQGFWPMPPRTALEPVIHGKIVRDGYTIEKVFFASLPGHYVTGNLYRPTGRSGKLPAVLCPYGHWPDGRFIWKSDADIQKDLTSGAEVDPNAARSPLQANCAMLARMGCIVFQYDMVGYGDDTRIPHRQGFTDVESVLRLQSFMGLQTWNSIRALDFVLGLPDVDGNRIAVAGSSGGGTQTMALGAVDPRPAVDFPMVMVSMNMQGGCVCENAPLYRVGTNNVEIASLFAPKPEGMASANDWTHDFLTRGLPQMKLIWGLYGKPDEVTDGYVNFGHNHNLHSRELQYNFLNQHLKLGWDSPVKEKPFEPVAPAQLSVYDAAHPRPADETDAGGVRAWMTRSSDEQLAELARDHARFAKTVREALQAMVVDELPQAGDVERVDGPAVLPRGAGECDLVLSRKGAGERVRGHLTIQRGWRGDVVIWAAPLAGPHPGPPPAYRGRGSEEHSIASTQACFPLTYRGKQSVAGPLPPPAYRGRGQEEQSIAGPRPSPPPAYRGREKSDPAAALAALLERGEAVLSIDPFPGEMKPEHRARHDKNPPYVGMELCYNRSLLAERVHDLLTAVAWVRGWNHGGQVRLIAFDGAGPQGLIARALCRDVIASAAIDLGGFDFDQVHETGDANLLPGALKYGGVYAMIALCDCGPTQVFGAPEGKWSKLADGLKQVKVSRRSIDAAGLVHALIEQGGAR